MTDLLTTEYLQGVVANQKAKLVELEALVLSLIKDGTIDDQQVIGTFEYLFNADWTKTVAYTVTVSVDVEVTLPITADEDESLSHWDFGVDDVSITHENYEVDVTGYAVTDITEG